MGRVLRWLLAALVVAAVLEPLFWRALMRVPAPAPATVEALRHRPDDALLAELAALSLQDIPRPAGAANAAAAVALAERLLAGGDLMAGLSGAPYALPFTPTAAAADRLLRARGVAPPATGVHYTLPFSEADALREDGIGALPYASLYLPDLLLSAFEASGNARFLAAARDAIVAYSHHERAAWRPAGFVWNDHAVAARAGVLVRFWHLYRTHASYDAAAATEIVWQAARCLRLLASGHDFNVATNHGLMSNVALLQLALAFPGLAPDVPAVPLAAARLRRQFGFLLADDGFVLEHSAHYQGLGVRLLGAAIRLLQLAGEPVPAAWEARFDAARQVLALLERPDGTLPAVGDTEVELLSGGVPSVSATAGGLQLFPLSGYAVWGTADSHSLVAWSHFAGHGHKLADEMSLNLWSGGRGWVTNSGYWGYGAWGRARAEGWVGSNAPHAVNEPADSPRQTVLRGSATSAQTVWLDLERSLSPSGRLNRQIVALGASRWLVLDRAADAGPALSEILWTFHPDLKLSALDGGRYRLSDNAAPGREFGITVRASGDLQATAFNGSREPFAGWAAVGRVGIAAPALRLRLPAGGWVATLFAAGAAPQAFSLQASSDSVWTAAGPGWQVQRRGRQIEVQQAGASEKLTLSPGPDVAAPRAELAARLAQALREHPRERELDAWRERMAGLLAALFVVQEALFIGLQRLRRAPGAATLAALAAWAASGLYLQFVYFAAN